MLFKCSYCSCPSAWQAVLPHPQISLSLSIPNTDDIWFTGRPHGLMEWLWARKTSTQGCQNLREYGHPVDQWPGRLLLMDCRLFSLGVDAAVESQGGIFENGHHLVKWCKGVILLAVLSDLSIFLPVKWPLSPIIFFQNRFLLIIEWI